MNEGYHGDYPLVNVYITNWKDPPCFMGKSTISMVIFQFANCNSHYQRVLLDTSCSFLKYHGYVPYCFWSNPLFCLGKTMVKRCATSTRWELQQRLRLEASEGLLGSFPNPGLQEEHAREANGFPQMQQVCEQPCDVEYWRDGMGLNDV